MEIRSEKDLSRHVLQYGDKVVFDVKGEIIYGFVDVDFINMRHGNGTDVHNGVIFGLLNVDKMDFCGEYYGYKPKGGDWPTSKRHDYVGLTRVVRSLYKTIGRPSPQGESMLTFNFINNGKG
jgi:hypothetical protein